MDDLTNKAGCFGTKCTLTDDEERALSVLMDIFIRWHQVMVMTIANPSALGHPGAFFL